MKSNAFAKITLAAALTASLLIATPAFAANDNTTENKSFVSGFFEYFSFDQIKDLFAPSEPIQSGPNEPGAEPPLDTPIDDSLEELKPGKDPAPSKPVKPVIPGFKFVDVTPEYKNAVQYLLDRGVTKGKTDTVFGIHEQITRADAAVWLAKELGLSLNAKPSGFSDVPKRAEASVNALVQAGVIKGKANNKYGSNDKLTRGQMALIIERGYNLDAGDTKAKFTDVSSGYQKAVNALVANNITKGVSSTTFGTNKNITRGQLALFVHRLSVMK